MIDHSQMRLGRKAVKRDSRTLRLARYLTGELPAPPESVDWMRAVLTWGMMLNDLLGDCTIAGAAHAVQAWTANLGQEQTIADSDILAAYECWDGYVAGDSSTDRGGVELDVLTRWRQSGLAGHRLLGFSQVNCGNLNEVRQAIALFGGVYIGLALPLSAQTQEIWDVASLQGASAPGSWGGHCVYVGRYDAGGFDCVTWGMVKRMTNAFWENYCDEAYALLGADWIGAKGSPAGFDLATLQQDLAAIK